MDSLCGHRRRWASCNVANAQPWAIPAATTTEHNPAHRTPSTTHLACPLGPLSATAQLLEPATAASPKGQAENGPKSAPTTPSHLCVGRDRTQTPVWPFMGRLRSCGGLAASQIRAKAGAKSRDPFSNLTSGPHGRGRTRGSARQTHSCGTRIASWVPQWVAPHIPSGRGNA